ncbi:Uridine kinase [Ruminococcus sp. YE71]|nr:Uridine kinase [Ruminococcus sp. YE78]SFW11054.1 Uridine kinase [Ruminococcus sp. YE71]
MFEPFVRTFLENHFKNPYDLYYSQGKEINFPYPPVMLVIMSVSEGLCLLLPDLPLFLHNIIFKLPLFVMDCIVFAYFCKSFPDSKLKVTVLYFLSPLILYATYIHSQLDIVPMTFLFLSLIYMTNSNSSRNFYLSALFLSLSLLCKFHIAAILPLIVLYLSKHRGKYTALFFTLLVIAMTALGILPFYCDGFVNGVVFNAAQSTVFSLYLSYGELKFYASIAAVLLIYLYAMNMNFINSDLLLGLGGLTFSIFLVLCIPMPGWYMWVILFIADFVIRSNGYQHSYLCYFMLQALYLVYFIFFHHTANGAVDFYFFTTDCSFIKSESSQLINISFTMLSATVLYMGFLMHKFCVAGNSFYHFHDASFVIGICGDSGTGKSTLLKHISSMFSSNSLLQIEGDGDHKWERGDSNWQNYTHLDPQANYLYRQAMDIKRLKNGEAVKRVDYDHDTGHFTRLKTFRPCRFISICGLHIFYLSQLRNIVDLKIYTEADEELRIFWKMNRDTDSRGYTREDILSQIQSRYKDAERYIYPQKEFADIIFHYFLDDEETGSVGMRMIINTQIDLDRFIEVLNGAGAAFSYDYSKDFRYRIIEYRPSLNKGLRSADFGKLFSQIFERGYDIISEEFFAESPSDGIQKLILIQAIYSKLREGS